ncbi:hypothetical protein V6767_20045 [Martelella sp. FLE1502]
MATILPEAKTTFFDSNGQPLAGGKVYFYIPNTTTPKDTWQDQEQTILNTNPVELDSAGRAIIFGSGSYRQIVKDVFGNVIWDKVTSEPLITSISYGGTAGGTANAITLSASNFTATDGATIGFFASATNTGATTLSVGGSPAVQVLKNSRSSGPTALSASDIRQGNFYWAIYSNSYSGFVLMTTPASADTFTGQIIIAAPQPTLAEFKSTVSGDARIQFTSDNGSNSYAEFGQRTGSDAYIWSRGKQYVFQSDGVFTAGNWFVGNDGNINGSAWNAWGSASAFTSINSRIEDRSYNRTRDWIVAQNNGDIGTYGWFRLNNSTLPGDVVSGSILTFSDGGGGSYGGAVTGSWKCMGFAPASTSTTLFMRIA